MRFFRLLVHNSVRNVFRFRSVSFSNIPIVRVVTSVEDDSVKLYFSNSSSLSIKAPTHQHVSSLLSVIKLKHTLLQKKAEMRRLIASKHFNTAQVAVETAEEYDVQLFENDKLIDDNTPNIDAWSKASILKIGDITYEVRYNSPAVKSMSLPNYIISGCFIRPHFQLECSSFKDCVFTWYRAVVNGINSNDINESDWIEVGSGFNYFVTPEDIGFHLKIVCSPRNGDQIGLNSAAISKNIVEAAPERFPFEDRQVLPRSKNDNSLFRCVSYNTLANIYVDARKFPYTSEKARDAYYRKQLLTRELIGYNSDVICLQEVQERVYEYDFLPIFKNIGFDGFYVRKGGRVFEGLAMFFRSTKYKAILNKGILLNEIIKEKVIFVDLLMKVSGNYKDMSKTLAQDTALQILLLENIEEPSNKILIANTHLYSNKDMPEVRLIQVGLCIYYLEHFIKTQLSDPVGILFCGDFNSLPDSEVYKFVTSGSFDCCPSWKSTSTNSSEDTTLKHNLYLESACGIPSYTNYTEDFYGCLDYIFYSENTLEVTEVVPMPSHKMVTAQVGLPSEYFPSDHLALVCTLKWKNKNV